MMNTTHSFTINACNRCRRRKAKCDPKFPSCSQCSRSGSLCEYTDPRTKLAVPRTAILALENELHELTLLSKAGNAQGQPGSQTVRPRIIANADMVRIDPGEDAHFLGVSSGMHLARSVLESAQNSDATLQSNEQHATAFADTAVNGPTEESVRLEMHPEVQCGFASLPARDTAMHLVDIFLGKYEVQYPIVVLDELLGIVQECYSEASDECNDTIFRARNDADVDGRGLFILNMVFAIALITLSRENPESLALSKMFSGAAMANFSAMMQKKDLRTLQCLQFLLLWSILQSSSAPVWNISGLCMRMCVDLGFHSEATISVSNSGTTVEDGTDTKRRLFWVTYTFDRTLSTLLGRPFTLCDETIDVCLPHRSLQVAKRDQILHWLELQRLQSQIVYRLYSPRSDGAKILDAVGTGFDTEISRETKQWKSDMTAKLQRWSSKAKNIADHASSYTNEKHGDHTLDWWEYWHQNAILLLHRPSPLKTQLDAEEAGICYTAAQSMIQLSFTRLQRGSADFAWVDLHYQLMSGITLLFLVWKHVPTRTKAKTNWISFKNCMMQWNYVLEQLARQWQRIQHASHVLTQLVNNTVEILEKEKCNRLSAGDVQILRQAHTISNMSRQNRNKKVLRQLVPQTPQRPQPHHISPHSNVIQLDHPNGTSPQNLGRRLSDETCFGTLRSDTVINADTNTLPPTHAQSHKQSGIFHTMQASPSLSNGQPVSPWILPADHGCHVHQQNNIRHHAGTPTSGSAETQEQPAFFLDLNQQEWQTIELNDTFGAVPENIAMLDYFSTFPVAAQGGTIGLGLGWQDGQIVQIGQDEPAVMEFAGVLQDLGGWPEPLTSSILNFQTDFPEGYHGH